MAYFGFGGGPIPSATRSFTNLATVAKASVQVGGYATSYGSLLIRAGTKAPYIPESGGTVYKYPLEGQRFPFTTRMVEKVTVIGGGPGGNRVNNEIPSGSMNGVNMTFTLSANFVAGSVAVYHNGQRLKQGAINDYVEQGTNQIVLTFAPESTDTLVVDYVLAEE